MQHSQGQQIREQHFKKQHLEEKFHTTTADKKQLGLVVKTLTRLGNGGNNLAEVAHDARNMVTALGFYCDLLQEPGVLAEPFRHYAGELRLVTAASRRLVDKLTTLDEHMAAPGQPIDNLAAQVRSLRTLLGAMTGAAIKLDVTAEGGNCPVQLAGEDLTRILVNLVKNAAEAIRTSGRIRVRVGVAEHIAGVATVARLTVEDDGPGIPPEFLDCIFETGFTTRLTHEQSDGGGTRGLGLSITRSLVEGAGGTIRAANRTPSGACIEIQLPVRGK